MEAALSAAARCWLACFVDFQFFSLHKYLHAHRAWLSSSKLPAGKASHLAANLISSGVPALAAIAAVSHFEGPGELASQRPVLAER